MDLALGAAARRKSSLFVIPLNIWIVRIFVEFDIVSFFLQRKCLCSSFHRWYYFVVPMLEWWVSWRLTSILRDTRGGKEIEEHLSDSVEPIPRPSKKGNRDKFLKHSKASSLPKHRANITAKLHQWGRPERPRIQAIHSGCAGHKPRPPRSNK